MARKRRTRAYEHRKLLDSHRHHYDGLLEFQGGGCQICGKEPSPRRRLDLDHDHREMVVRGLLDPRCNQALPAWVTPEWLRAAADYLEDPPYERYLKTLEETII